MTEIRLTEAERDELCDAVMDYGVTMTTSAPWRMDKYIVPAVERIIAARQSHVTAPLAADQPPVCPDHREAQHRDNKPPWCDSCGWRHGEPARRYGNAKITTTEETA